MFSSEAAGNNHFYPLVCGLSATPSPLLHTHETPPRSTSPTPPLPSTLSNKEDDIGKVFNLYTRLVYSGSPSSLQLRTQLWGFIRAEVLDMKMVLGTTGYFHIFFLLRLFFFTFYFFLLVFFLLIILTLAFRSTQSCTYLEHFYYSLKVLFSFKFGVLI